MIFRRSEMISVFTEKVLVFTEIIFRRPEIVSVFTKIISVNTKMIFIFT